VLGQPDKPIQGTVVTQDGQPIEGVSVYGREHATTDSKGAFRFQHPGPVIHFYKGNLQPQSVVIQPGSSTLRVTMRPATNSMSVPDCGPLQQGLKRIGWGQYGLQFTLSERNLDVQGGNVDVDYVRYVIKREKSSSVMELWLGPTAGGVDPSDDRFIESIDFVQRHLIYRNSMTGLDSRGQLRAAEVGVMRHSSTQEERFTTKPPQRTLLLSIE
jgi:hypothetical protein